ncbi:hypothetical protein QR98_0075900 [Sarcoptes scabiei]|uniref:Uncharacterized protein n=1 Tax=Sarcoptes scabiei TaxID=52283 RepID=A0A132AF57_SARSC|nr:hypothetical protein QR98_0075900 [Sarcoptes scabiei]
MQCRSFSDQANNGPISREVEVFVNVYDHPKTGFSCHGKIAGEYYADPATKCAVYYVCIPNPIGTMSAQSFACPNGTIFSQATRVCRPHEEATFTKNREGTLAGYRSPNRPAASTTTTTTTTTTTEQPPPPPPLPSDLNGGLEYDYDYGDYNDTVAIIIGTMMRKTVISFYEASIISITCFRPLQR